MFRTTNRLRRTVAATALAFTITSGVVVATPAVASAQTTVSSISEGDTGTAVAEIQRNLNRHGIPVAIDSDYGPATRSAIRELQQRYGLQIDGVVGPVTAAAIEGPIQYLREGSTGLAVTRLQERLKAHLNTNLTTDGDFGSSTASAVRTLQRRFELQPDSIAGPDVYNAAYGAPKPFNSGSSGPTFDELITPDPATQPNPHLIPLADLPEPGRSTTAIQLTQQMSLAAFTNMHPLGGPSVNFYGWDNAQPPADLPNLDFADWLGPQDYCTRAPEFTADGNTDFRPACLRHDFCIDNLEVADLKGNRTWRVRCDDQFSQDMDYLCDIANDAFVPRTACRTIATEYVIVVRGWTELNTLFT